MSACRSSSNFSSPSCIRCFIRFPEMFPQRRKDAKRCRVSIVLSLRLCAFAGNLLPAQNGSAVYVKHLARDVVGPGAAQKNYWSRNLLGRRYTTERNDPLNRFMCRVIRERIGRHLSIHPTRRDAVNVNPKATQLRRQRLRERNLPAL